MRAAIGGDGAKNVPGLVQDHDTVFGLDDLNRIWGVDLPRHADGQARVHFAVEQVELLLAPVGQYGLRASSQIRRVGALPDSGQVSLPGAVIRGLTGGEA